MSRRLQFQVMSSIAAVGQRMTRARSALANACFCIFIEGTISFACFKPCLLSPVSFWNSRKRFTRKQDGFQARLVMLAFALSSRLESCCCLGLEVNMLYNSLLGAERKMDAASDDEPKRSEWLNLAPPCKSIQRISSNRDGLTPHTN